jgi:hypothetical protein
MAIRSALLDAVAVVSAAVGSTPAGAALGLLLEASHRFGLMPTRTIQIIVVLVAVFLEATPHMAVRLMPTKGTVSHVITPLKAGATRVLGITANSLEVE